MDRVAKKSPGAVISTLPAMFGGPQGWADIPDDLLHQIIAHFTLSSDLLAFMCTCRFWLTAALSCPSAFSFTLSPLFLMPRTRYLPRSHRGRRIRGSKCHLSECKWHLKDPANKAFSLRCSMPPKVPVRLYFVGCSFGHLIFFYGKRMLLVDVLTGTEVRPPQMPAIGDDLIHYGALTAPLTPTTTSHLFVCTGGSLLHWQVGSSHWSELPLDDDHEDIVQIFAFKGCIFAMDEDRTLFSVQLGPDQLRMRELVITYLAFDTPSMFTRPWLVPCGNTLLLVEYAASSMRPQCATFRAYRLNWSALPPRWVEVDTLEDRAVFVSLDRRCQAFSCVHPERWGGQRNCIYLATKLPMRLAAFRLGQEVSSEDLRFVKSSVGDPLLATSFDELEPLWVLPDHVGKWAVRAMTTPTMWASGQSGP